MTDSDAVPVRKTVWWLIEAGMCGAFGGLVSHVLHGLLQTLRHFEYYAFFILVGSLLIAIAAVGAMLVGLWALVAASARDRLGMRWKPSRRAAAAVCVVGWLPWFGPDEARVSLSWPLAVWPGLVMSTVWFVGVAALAVGIRRVRRVAIALLVIVAVAWLPVRDVVVGSAVDAALDQHSIPRTMALTASWDGYAPDKYQRVGSEVRVQYELQVPFSCPDCGSSGVLTVDPVPDYDPCDFPMARPDGENGPVVGCRQIDARTWARLTTDQGCDVIQVRGKHLVGVYEDDCPAPEILLDVLATVRPADPADVFART